MISPATPLAVPSLEYINPDENFERGVRRQREMQEWTAKERQKQLVYSVTEAVTECIDQWLPPVHFFPQNLYEGEYEMDLYDLRAWADEEAVRMADSVVGMGRNDVQQGLLCDIRALRGSSDNADIFYRHYRRPLPATGMYPILLSLELEEQDARLASNVGAFMKELNAKVSAEAIK